MSFTTGTRVGPYEILASIGEGGMGEVYRARDPRLNRDVAIKTSREEFSDRFVREARAIAALNHPNICHLYDVGPNYLVMELVEGETLRGPLALDEALPLARQIASALEAAHEKGIIHRDLKPANIQVTPDGVVKVLDFGLARLAVPDDADPGNSPTMTMGSPTQAGTILGTAAYMAPEQARGKTADKRADIWAFGVVFYELLTGSRLFSGDTVSDILAGVLKETPDLSRVPPQVRRLIAACLEKDPKKRVRDVGDLWQLLDDTPAAPAQPATRPVLLPWALAALGIATAAAVSWQHFRETPPVVPLVRFTLDPPPNSRFAPLAGSTPAGLISPDGGYVVFPVSGPDGRSLWLRPLADTVAQPLPGTDSATPGCWSPDSKSLVFMAGRELKRIDIASGVVHALGNVTVAGTLGGVPCSWNSDGVILTGGPLHRISAAGGSPTPVDVSIAARSGQFAATRHPVFLPDGRHFLVAVGAPEVDIWIGSLDAPDDVVHLMKSDSQALYSDGHVLFVSGTTLLARPFDAAALAFTGEAVPVVENLRNNVHRRSNQAAFSVSSNGWLVYQQSFGPELLGLTLLDRSGRRVGTIGEPADLFDAVYSQDRTRIAATITDDSRGGSTSNIWTFDVHSGLRNRLTFGVAAHNGPLWAPDGRTLLFYSLPPNPGTYRKPADGSATEELVLANAVPRSLSRDGRFLAYTTRDTATSDIWILPEPLGDVGATKPVPFRQSPANELFPQFSPDGRWIAYQSDESGRDEIYLAPFPGPGPSRQVSTGGGSRARWNPNGRELFFISQDRQMMSAEIALGATAQVGAVRALFPNFTPMSFDVSADGQRFLTILEPEGATEEPVTVVQNWQALLKR